MKIKAFCKVGVPANGASTASASNFDGVDVSDLAGRANVLILDGVRARRNGEKPPQLSRTRIDWGAVLIGGLTLVCLSVGGVMFALVGISWIAASSMRAFVG